MNIREHTENISDEAVRDATGQAWEAWFTLLDQYNATALSHKAIAGYLHQEHGESGWWAQSITGAYERARGLRQRYQMPDGYKVSVSRVVNVPLSTLYQAWEDPDKRRQWLGTHTFTITSATIDKSLRALWEDKTRISLLFYAKGEHKSQVVIEHSKVTDADDAERRKAIWADHLDALKQTLE